LSRLQLRTPLRIRSHAIVGRGPSRTIVAQWQQDSVVLDYGVALCSQTSAVRIHFLRQRQMSEARGTAPSLPRFSDHAHMLDGLSQRRQQIFDCTFCATNRQINYQVASNQATQTHYQQMRLGSDAQLAQRTPHLCNSDNPAQYCDFDSRHSPSSFCMVTFI
jgi:sulfur relay (sulfurtransferase) complex TusBCD TusD component (DsrE family)